MTDKNILGVDIGYGFCKTYNGSVFKVFPSTVSERVPDSTFGELSPVIVNGNKFLTAEEADREGLGIIKTTTSDFVMSDAWVALLGSALEKNQFRSNEGTIVLGIPPGLYTKDFAVDVTDKIKKYIVHTTNSNFTYDMSRFTFKAIPQSAGIFVSYIAGHREDFNKNIAVVDIGHRTIDMTFFAGGQYIEGACESVNKGTVTLLDQVIKAYYKVHQLTINYAAAREYLKTGKITMFQEDFTLTRQNIIAPYAKEVAAIINDFFEKLPSPAEIAIIGGGGVVMLKGLITLKRKLVVVANPEFANSIGYWHYGSGDWR